MLTGQTPIKGVRYKVQLLLNGWVLAALLWCIGAGIKSVDDNILNGWISRVGTYFVYAGWACGLISLLNSTH
ncbi:hypothetical protein M5G27_18115, partial [Pseudomonas shahriarae]